MKTTFVVAVLLGLANYPSQSNAMEVVRHHRMAPHSRQYIQARDIDALDLA